jgi:formylglycine-generating enzyme required for sulfatase activity
VRVALALSLFGFLPGCGRSSATHAQADAVVVNTTAVVVEVDAGFVSAASELAAPIVDPGGARALAAPSVAGQRIDIAAGTFASGSSPGDEGREASVEPALVDVTMGAFAMDALPYPNDPARAPELVGSQSEAAKLCSERGARLCTELEWERACKGPESDRYATGSTWNVACDRAPSRCASGFGVRAMGFMREWTDSNASFSHSSSSSSGRGEAPIVRGGPATARRCAARSRATGKGMPAQMAFRCCHGERNDIAIAPIEPRPAFRRTDLDASDLAKIFAEVPELRRISEGVRLFNESDVKSIVARGAPRTNSEEANRAEGISFATAPILWSPEPGVELLVATGRAKKTGFVVALWTLPREKYRLASSFLFLDDAAPVALAYEPSRRRELRWTTCWGCAGEQGAVSLRDDGRAVIVQY